MGSTSDWETMRHAAQVLADFGVPHEKKVVSAHRTPKLLASFADRAEARGLEVIIAGAGAPRTCPAWWRPKPFCPSWAFPWKAGP